MSRADALALRHEALCFARAFPKDAASLRRTLRELRDFEPRVRRVPVELAHYLAFKGSVAIDGVSLTVNGVDGDTFDVLTIPHTLERTTVGALGAGAAVNIEVDLIARYIERMLSKTSTPNGSGITLARLAEAGFGGGHNT